MSSTAARLRSVLYMPGANERALEKARELPADALILDLEDAVAPGAKAEARARVCEAATSGGYGDRTVTIRVNGMGTEWHAADLAAVAAAGPDAILVPKVNSADDLLTIERALERAGAPQATRIWAMLETPAAVLRAAEIAAASQRLSMLVMGTNDLLTSCARRLPWTRVTGDEPRALPVGRACRAPVDPRRGLQRGARRDGFEPECLRAGELGFDGKTLIHPGQVEICNRVFSPSRSGGRPRAACDRGL